MLNFCINIIVGLGMLFYLLMNGFKKNKMMFNFVSMVYVKGW